MRHSLYKYYSTRKWADAFLDGRLRFNSLAYFRDFEDALRVGCCRKLFENSATGG
jgi:hypothetical protein